MMKSLGGDLFFVMCLLKSIGSPLYIVLQAKRQSEENIV